VTAICSVTSYTNSAVNEQMNECGYIFFSSSLDSICLEYLEMHLLKLLAVCLCKM